MTQLMKIIDRDRDKLVLRSSGIGVALLFAFTFIPGGIFSFLLGWAIYFSEASHLIAASVMPIVIGVIFPLAGIYFAVVFAEVKTYTFDKETNSFLLQKQALRGGFQPTVREFPLHLICGVEVTENFSGADTPSSYYPRLILSWIYWRVPLPDSASDRDAANLAKTIADFLNIPYFPYLSKAPVQIFEQKIAENCPPGVYSWKYVENEVARLKEAFDRDPDNTEVCLELAMMTYYVDRAKAIPYLERAERLYESTRQSDRAAIIGVIKHSIKEPPTIKAARK